MAVKINENIINQIKEMFINGETKQYIKKTLKISEPTIRKYTDGIAQEKNKRVVHNKTDKDLELKIVNYFKEGKTAKEIGDLTNKGEGTIRGILQRNNLNYKKKKYDDDIYFKKIKKLLDEGKNSTEISKILNIPTGTISKICKRLNLKLKGNDLTEKEKEIIFHMHKENYNTVEIGEVIKRHSNTIGKFLKENGCELSNQVKTFRPKEEETIINLYIKENKTTIEISEMFDCCDNFIAKILRKNNIKIRESQRRSIIKNHDFFETIDCEAKAYFLGLMITDGAVIKPKNRKNRKIAITLKEEDKHILESFANLLGADKNKVKTFKNEKRHECYIQFTSEKMAQDLEKYGVITHKTFQTFLPSLKKEFMPHLVRGLFDGDGSVNIQKTIRYSSLRVQFYGTPKICNQYADFLNNEINFSRNKVYNKESVSFTSHSKKNDVKNFYEYIYKNANFYLNRKKLIFEKNLDMLIYKSEIHANTELTI